MLLGHLKTSLGRPRKGWKAGGGFLPSGTGGAGANAAATGTLPQFGPQALSAMGAGEQ
jgi:hypothetical protein